MEPVEVLRERFPALEIRDVRAIEVGWDSHVLEVNGEFVFRFPRRPEVEEWVERETLLLPELAKTLPVEVPRFDFVARNGLLCVGYRKLVGAAAGADLSERAGEELGRFLSALHRFPVERARSLGVPYFDPAAWRAHFERFCGELRQRVVPLRAQDERERAERLFTLVPGLDFDPVLVHADLGPEHVLVREGRVAGVIDWSDARVGDPALDFAWCLHGTSNEVAEAIARTYGLDAVAEAIARTYGLDAETRERSLFYHRLGPWYEVLFGLDTERPRFVESGLAGLRSRLRG